MSTKDTTRKSCLECIYADFIGDRFIACYYPRLPGWLNGSPCPYFKLTPYLQEVENDSNES